MTSIVTPNLYDLLLNNIQRRVTVPSTPRIPGTQYGGPRSRVLMPALPESTPPAQPSTTPAAASPSPTAQPAQKPGIMGKLNAALNSPQAMYALMGASQQLLSPRQWGESEFQHVASAIPAAYNMIATWRALQHQRDVEERKMKMEERKVDIDASRADTAKAAQQAEAAYQDKMAGVAQGQLNRQTEADKQTVFHQGELLKLENKKVTALEQETKQRQAEWQAHLQRQDQTELAAQQRATAELEYRKAMLAHAMAKTNIERIKALNEAKGDKAQLQAYKIIFDAVGQAQAAQASTMILGDDAVAQMEKSRNKMIQDMTQTFRENGVLPPGKQQPQQQQPQTNGQASPAASASQEFKPGQRYILDAEAARQLQAAGHKDATPGSYWIFDGKTLKPEAKKAPAPKPAESAKPASPPVQGPKKPEPPPVPLKERLEGYYDSFGNWVTSSAKKFGEGAEKAAGSVMKTTGLK